MRARIRVDLIDLPYLFLHLFLLNVHTLRRNDRFPQNIVSLGPLHGVTGLREKHRYNITPWARKLSDDEDSDTEEDERLAVAAAMFSMAQRLKKGELLSGN